MKNTPSRFIVLLLLLAAVGVGVTAVTSCNARRRLVEVFDNGPVGGPPGASEGYMWVGRDAMPPPGKSWKPTDPASLTPEQRARIR